MQKIYILGGARSGKSFLGKKLSEKTDTEHFDLDRVVFDPKFVVRSKEERAQKLATILQNKKWIVEGAYAEDWILPALQTAEQIIWLDTSAIIKLYRFIRRVFEEGINGQENLYGRGRLAIGLKYKEWDRSRARYKTLLKPFKSKVTILRSKKDLRGFLN